MEKKHNVIVETGKDGFWAFLQRDEDIDACITSYGKTVSKCMEDFYRAYDDVREILKSEGKDLPAMEFNFIFDVGAFFNYYPLNVSAFAKYIGINPSLMRQYTSGVREPKEKNLSKIHDGINKILSDIASGQLIEKPVLQYV